jgi:S-adenosyl-L-methionine hydrolase (adenosine-forming)
MRKHAVGGVITLTTDFGTRDHYVAAMKGVLASLCPQARVIDVTHELPPFGILAGAYAIHQAAPFFPAATIHIVVIDPGVGTSRRALLVDTGHHFFLAPDNGVLSFILRENPEAHVWELTNRRLWLDAVSSTFHGRDVFAPVAAALAAGKVKPKDTGWRCGDPVILDSLEPAEIKLGVWRGIVLSVDRFGNVITNFASEDSVAALGRGFRLEIGRHRVTAFHQTFGEAAAGELFGYPGSSGYLEIAMNQGSAAEHLGVAPGAVLTLRQKPREGTA